MKQRGRFVYCRGQKRFGRLDMHGGQLPASASWPDRDDDSRRLSKQHAINSTACSVLNQKPAIPALKNHGGRSIVLICRRSRACVCAGARGLFRLTRRVRSSSSRWRSSCRRHTVCNSCTPASSPRRSAEKRARPAHRPPTAAMRDRSARLGGVQPCRLPAVGKAQDLANGVLFLCTGRRLHDRPELVIDGA